MKTRWKIAYIVLVSDIAFASVNFLFDRYGITLEEKTGWSPLWVNIHRPISNIADVYTREHIPSHGGGYEAMFALALFYIANFFYFFIIGYMVGLLIEKAVALQRS